MLDEVEEVFAGHCAVLSGGEEFGVRRALVVDTRALQFQRETLTDQLNLSIQVPSNESR